MRTLPSDLRKLVTEHPQEVRDALRKLREDGSTPVTLTIPGRKSIVIARVTTTKPAK